MLTALILATALSAELPAPAKDWGLSADDFTKASAGEVVVKGEIYKTPDGKDAGRGKAYTVINTPPEAIFQQLRRYEELAQFMPRLKKVTVVEKTETTGKAIQDVKIVLSSFEYTLLLVWDHPAMKMSWTTDHTAKNDIKDTTGSWEMKPLADGKQTLLQYTITVDSGSSVPHFLQDYLTKRDLPEVLLSMKRRVESGGKWTKD